MDPGFRRGDAGLKGLTRQAGPSRRRRHRIHGAHRSCFSRATHAMATTESRKTHLLRPVETPKAKPAIEAEAPTAHGQFPRVRMRRNRADGWTRRLVAENRLT